MVFIRSVMVWLIFILAESLNGAVRTIWLIPTLGDRTAHQWSFGLGAILIVAIATLSIRWLNPARRSDLLVIGLLWSLLTLGFEISLGRLLGYSWPQIAADYDLANGGLMALGLLWVAVAPWMAKGLHGKLSHFIQHQFNS